MQKALEGAVGSCVTRNNYEVTLMHILNQILATRGLEFEAILQHFKIEPLVVQSIVAKELKYLESGNTGKPVFSPLMIKVLETAWMETSLNLFLNEITSGSLLLTLKKHPELVGEELKDAFLLIKSEELSAKFFEITKTAREGAPSNRNASSAGGNANPDNQSHLARFTVNFTELAKKGKIDPIFGRDAEILQILDILSRRRKNNPIMIGEAGVGKTAVIEGLALRIAENDVPDMLKDVQIHSLDMGLLSAGAGVRGEFENRLKGVIKEVKEAQNSVILFIDEAHTLIGAGGEAGQNDAANLLKPEMARGELKILAATTFTEFRKYFEKDPAMARRFQSVTIKEPTPAEAAIMLRGLRKKYEEFHGVRIAHDSISAACELSHKFIAGRQLPDKAVDLLDTATARVKMGLKTKPSKLVQCEQQIQNLSKEMESLNEDGKSGLASVSEKIATLEDELKLTRQLQDEISQQWKKELSLVEEIHQLQSHILAEDNNENKNQIKEQIDQKWLELEATQGETALVNPHVSPSVIAGVISEWTGIPAGSMVKDEAQTLLKLEDLLNERVKGQSWGISELASTLRNAKAGLKNSDAPMGVFLITGPSGVGKTEVANTISDLMFGGSTSVVTINMSEYQDSMSVTQLKGASAGYVGYGDGGVLTEGVRKRPYTVVILDEVEKAHKDVLNMFYQVFDKGILRDGEGRDISFKNTVIIMTSNLGTDTITQMAMSEESYTYNEYKEAITPELTAHFAPALLGRCKIVPFFPLGLDVLSEIVKIKMGKVKNRLKEKHSLVFGTSEEVIEAIVSKCSTNQAGARNLDSIIDEYVLPDLSKNLLINLVNEKQYTHLYLCFNRETSGFDYRFSENGLDIPENEPTEAK